MKKTPFILSIMFVVFLIVVFSTVFSGPENVDVVSGNGRIEATEIGISAKVAGRVEEIYVNEGDRVTAGDVVAKLDTTTINSQLQQAKAQRQQAKSAVEAANMAVAQRQSEKSALQAALLQTKAELKAAEAHAARTNELSKRVQCLSNWQKII